MTSSSENGGEVQATFSCKDITIQGISDSAISSNTQTQQTTGNENNQTTNTTANSDNSTTENTTKVDTSSNTAQ